ncbi:MAG: type II toxin-antitoxin system VapC family toxin [Actinomycetota bacterium]|nr:type II toxin-antitoxin system VapC family toxin [Actinomycetota bacterium]
MILYLDSSAMVKLYAREPHREDVRAAIGEATLVCASLLVYAEARSAFSRKVRDGHLDDERHDALVERLDDEIADAYALYPVGEELVYFAGDLTREHGLRAYDAVHLATALTFRDEARSEAATSRAGSPGEPEELLMLTFDKDLYKAARSEGFAYELHAMEELVGPVGEEPEDAGGGR